MIELEFEPRQPNTQIGLSGRGYENGILSFKPIGFHHTYVTGVT